MKHWAMVVAVLYGALLVVLTVPATMLAFAPKVVATEAAKVFETWGFWTWIPVMLISQFAFLAVPVRVASRRPMTRKPLWLTVLAGGLMAGGLAMGACYSIFEFIYADKPGGDWLGWLGIGLIFVVWLVWAVVFFRWGRKVAPEDVVSRQRRWLLNGSILELLIAVPTHIVARCRDYCCAGFMTFLGLTMGISVMLFSFGPAVFFLFVERWKRLHPDRGGSVESTDPGLSAG
jgi:hypothetical protein